jgi:hypothetical protein
VVESFDDDDRVELLSSRLVHVHQRHRVGFCRAAGDHLLGEDTAHGVRGTRVGGLAVPDASESPGEGVGGVQQAEQPRLAEYLLQFPRSGLVQPGAGELPVGDRPPGEQEPCVVGRDDRFPGFRARGPTVQECRDRVLGGGDD